MLSAPGGQYARGGPTALAPRAKWGWMNGWMDGQMGRWVDEQMGRWVGGWLDGWMAGWLDMDMSVDMDGLRREAMIIDIVRM